jgi:hypothetical protein
MDADLGARLRAIGEFVEELEAPTFVAGAWHQSERREEGDDKDVWTLPWFELSERGLAFVRALGGIMETFDWPTCAATPAAQALYHDREALASASIEDLRRIATAVLRSDRFNEGQLSDAFDSGLMAAIARRAAALAER